MEVFPKINELKFFEREIRIYFVKLRGLLVELKKFKPLLFVHGRNYSSNNVPTGYRQTRTCQTGNAPQYDLTNEHHKPGEKPEPNCFSI